MLHHPVAHRHRFHLAHGRTVAHVVKRYFCLAQKVDQARAFLAQAGKHETPVAVDTGCGHHAAIGVIGVHAGAVVAFDQRNGLDFAIQVKAPGVVRADKTLAGVAALVAAQLHTPVRATVVKHTHTAVSVTHHDHRLTANLHGEVITDLFDL